MDLKSNERYKKSTNKNSNNNSNNNVYDIICYYEEQPDNESHVNDVIQNIEKANRHNLHKDKWLIWKLSGCLLINVLLSAPIYSYGTIYLQQMEKFDMQPLLIWPPLIFNAQYLLVTPWLFHTISTPSSTQSNSLTSDKSILMELSSKNIIVISTLILSMAITISGLAFTFLNANFFMILIFYSLLGGEYI